VQAESSAKFNRTSPKRRLQQGR